jgi:hypothetical protein
VAKGDILIKGVSVSLSLVRKFWSRVDVRDDPKECWEWKAGRASKKEGFNYGVFWIPELRSVLTHRLALSFYKGVWVGDEKDVLHSCDNPPCCNPFHLRSGLQLDNMRDMNQRGRRQCQRGVDRPAAKLNPAKVRIIRRIYDPAKRNKAALARRFGVDKNVIQLVVERKAWRHVA